MKIQSTVETFWGPGKGQSVGHEGELCRESEGVHRGHNHLLFSPDDHIIWYAGHKIYLAEG